MSADLTVRKVRPEGVEGAIVEFCRFARASGFNAGVKETMDALESVFLVSLADPRSFKAALRAVLCSSRAEWDRFDAIFEEFWARSPNVQPAESGVERAHSKPAAHSRETANVQTIRTNLSEAPGDRTDPDGKSVSGASLMERNRRTDFSLVPQNDLQDLERLAERLLERMCLRLSRRLRLERKGRVDLRRTIRASIGRGGDPVDLRYKGPKKQQPRLVAFIDVSGSMELYSLFLLKFAFALQKHFHHAHTFVFSTKAIDVTQPLNARRLDSAFQLLGCMPAGWSGGTRIGESLAQINAVRGTRLLSPDTLFIIFSDGLETGDPKRLGVEMQMIRRRVKRVIWLNPLAAMENYQPLARGMSAALPHVDCFAAANSLESLLRLEKKLVRAALR